MNYGIKEILDSYKGLKKYYKEFEKELFTPKLEEGNVKSGKHK